MKRFGSGTLTNVPATVISAWIISASSCAVFFSFCIVQTLASIPVPRRQRRGGDAGARLDTHGRVDPRPGVASASNLVPKSATSDGDKTKGPALPVAVFGEIPWQ